jgi:BRCA1-associated protein
MGENHKETGELKETFNSLERGSEKEKKRGERSAEIARGFGRRSLMEEKMVGEGPM